MTVNIDDLFEGLDESSANFHLHASRTSTALAKAKELGGEHSSAYKNIKKHHDKLQGSGGHKYYKEYMRKKGLGSHSKTSVPSVKEDAPTNCAGGGNVAAIGVGPKGEPGVKKKKKADVVVADMMRRKIKS